MRNEIIIEKLKSLLEYVNKMDNYENIGYERREMMKK